MSDLTELRCQIDQIDTELVKLLNQRAQVLFDPFSNHEGLARNQRSQTDPTNATVTAARSLRLEIFMYLPEKSWFMKKFYQKTRDLYPTLPSNPSLEKSCRPRLHYKNPLKLDI
jgi:hypothetical protein